jgi:hypothetical protein
MPWRVANTLMSSQVEDYEALGVVAGDLLWIEVTRVDEGGSATIPCRVLGASGKYISFTPGSLMPASGDQGDLTMEEMQPIFFDLRLPEILEGTNGLVFGMAASEVDQLLRSRVFRSTYYNLPISASSIIDLDLTSIRLRASHVVRNTRVPVDDSVMSVPALFEYISEPEVAESEDGQVWLQGKDGSLMSLPRVPIVAVENRDFTLGAQSFRGSNLHTEAASGLMVIPSGDLLDRDVRAGDFLDITSGPDSRRYQITEVLDSETVRVLGVDGTLPRFTVTAGVYTITRRTEGNFLRFADGLFNPTYPAPERLWAETTFFDNSDYIEDNFGVKVGITKYALDEFGSSQISYKGAVSGLMYVWTFGPQVENARVGASIMLGLPVTETNGRIISIQDDYTATQGRILIEELNSDGELTGLVRPYMYRRGLDDSLDIFTGLAINPDTGSVYKEGDGVSAFRALTKTVLIGDSVNSPVWWDLSGGSAEAELRKYQTWHCLVDVSQVDSRDLPLVADFLSKVRPIYTEAYLSAIVYLVDQVVVEDALLLGISRNMLDDIAFGAEVTHGLDSHNDGSLELQRGDFGTFSTRTLFQGHDLTTLAGSGIVTSARGGFTLEDLDGVNPWFLDTVQTSGLGLVRIGDILYITSGPNVGRYTVIGVTNDTTLTVSERTGWPPRSIPPAQFAAAAGQAFFIERQNKNPIVSGTAVTVLGDEVVTDATANFVSDGVDVGDKLLITSGPDYGEYIVMEVGEWVTGSLLNRNTKLTLDRPIVTGGSAPYRVEREGYRTNPLYVSATGEVAVAGQLFIDNLSGVLMAGLQFGDEVHILSGTGGGLDGQTFTVIDFSDTTLFLDRVTPDADTGLELEVRRARVFTDVADSDLAYEQLSLYDEVVLDVYRVQAEFLSAVTLTLSGSTATAGSDLQAAGVLAGMLIELPTGGTFTITSVVGTVASIAPVLFPSTGALVCDILMDDNDHVWSVNGVYVASLAPSMPGVRSGDIVLLEGEEYPILSVSGSAIVLTRDTGLLGDTYALKIIRRSRP